MHLLSAVYSRSLLTSSAGSSGWVSPLRAQLWPLRHARQRVVAFGRRPKVPVEEPGRGQLPLRDDHYELPDPSNASAGVDDIVLQQRAAAGSDAAAPELPPQGRRRGRRSRQQSELAAAEASAGEQQQGAGQGSVGGVGSSVDDDDDDEEYLEEDEFEEEGEGEGEGEGGGSATELVFKLERRGEGWGEELFPSIRVEKRTIFTKSKHKCQHPDPWEEGSLEYYLIEVGVPPGDVDRVVEQAVAWRYTPGGRALIDRRRRSRVERNVRLVVQHLEMEGGIPFGPKGMGAILARVPEIMLCKPTTNDRWDRRAVELVAFQHTHGHCNVPEDWAENPELGAWVKRQRVARAAGQLSDDRMAILQGLGFEFGEVAQMTDEWEARFDQLIDWMLWHKENQQRFSWLGVDWGHRGGITARELALWVRLQGEFRRRNLLPAEAIKRFDAIGVDWDSKDGTPAEHEWMQQFSRLLYVIERHNTVTRPYLLQTARLGRPKAGATSGANGNAAPAPSDEEDTTDGSDDEVYHKSSSAAHRGRAKLQQELAARRRALAVADLRCEAGLRFWLERQRWLWRQGRLPTEQVLMLQLAGVDMERYTSAQWQAEAHTAAALLQRSEISLTPPPHHNATAALQQQQQQQQQPAAQGLSATARSTRLGGARLQQQQQQQPNPAPAAGWGPQQQQETRTAGVQRGRAPAGMPDQPSLARGEGRGAPPQPSQRVEGEVAPRGCLRLRVRRWVQTQAALFHDGHLSPAQLRYLAFLGVTWVLSDEVMHMSDAAWRARFDQLVALCKAAAADGIPPAAAAVVADRDLREWLRHQRGLAALGLLAEERRRLLGALGVGWGHPRGEAERTWDARLSQLLAFKAQHGHLAVPANYAPYPGLGAWVATQRRLMTLDGALDPGCAAQLVAIGILPLPLGREAEGEGGAGDVGRAEAPQQMQQPQRQQPGRQQMAQLGRGLL